MTEQRYCIRPDYQARPTPAYFADVQSDGKQWQPDVISIAVHIARARGVRRIVDIGCGRASGYIPYADEFQITGVDYGDNLDYCWNTYSWGTWITCDLENDIPEVDTRGAVVVCADCIEHLVKPDMLLATLMTSAVCAECVILSTPDRERVYGYDRLDMPGNVHHIREWKLDELTELIESCGLAIAWRGWTVSNNVDRLKNTCLMVCTRGDRVYNEVCIDGIFDVEAAK